MKSKASSTITARSSSYKLAIEILREVLRKAKVYLHTIERNKTWRANILSSELNTALILDSTIVNDTTLVDFMVATRNLTTSASKICDNIYSVSIIVNPGRDIRTSKGVYLILIPASKP
ncbi:hypothetical protein PABY_13660 [Pyrodictium abyssi]|uniref:Uncharacterized protein n=1 Tax=Pyrodictium abyssi TaxID=54256 RepID=A0ABM8IW64_9CREN|nr:hypothetical protein PABY_13660 [Pyrodictium abyssi]